MGILGCEYTCVFHLLELVLGDGSELFQAESQAGRVPVFSAAVICAQDHYCCRRLVGHDCQKSWLMGWLTDSAAGLLVAGLKWALHLCPP